MKIYIILFLLVICLISCTDNKQNIAAKVGDKIISIQDIDKLVEQEIYDQKNTIYFIRKYALDINIKNAILEIEANKFEIAIDSLLNRNINTMSKNYSIDKFINDNNLNKQIPVRDRVYKTVAYDSKEGQREIKKAYDKYIYNYYVDSLKKKYEIDILLSPPKRPNINISDCKNIFWRGNLESIIELIIVSDFECQMCIDNKEIYQQLYVKYKNIIKFGYVNYSGRNTLSSMAILAAAKQDKFWDMYESINSEEKLLSKSEIFKLASKIGLDTNEFKSVFNSEQLITEIEESYNYLRGKGIDATPTVLINGQLVHYSNSLTEIENLINMNLRE